jgi:hypothetical protein
MKLIKHLSDYWVSYVIILLMCFVGIVVFSDNTNYPRWRLMKLEQDNAALEKMNRNLLKETDSLRKSFLATEAKMQEYRRQDSALQQKSDSLSVKLNHIKSAYEKVRHRVDKFDSDSLRKYFTELNPD